MKWAEGNIQILFSALPFVVFNFDFCIFSHLINYAWIKANQNKQNLKIASAHFIAISLESWVENTCLKCSFPSSDTFGGVLKSTFSEKCNSKFLWGNTSSSPPLIRQRKQRRGYSESTRPLSMNARDERLAYACFYSINSHSIPLWSRFCSLSGI